MNVTTRPAQGELPLVVGVTGHRDLAAGSVDALERAVDAIFTTLTTDYPNTPLIVLSALAEGADRLVARVGLRRGLKLIVPLPMPKEQYEADFTTESSLLEFRSLCDRADAVYAVAFTDPEHGPKEPLAGPVRDRRYAAGGAYMAVNSDVLIALWDGEPTGRLGGTACIVRYKLDGVPEPFGTERSPLDAVESGPVYHIMTPREGRAEPRKPFALKVLVPHAWDEDPKKGEAFYRKIYHRIDTFNADFRKLGSSAAARCPSESPATHLYAIADALAIRYQRKARGALGRIFWIVGFSVLAFEVFAHLDHRTFFLALDVFGFLIATLIFKWVQNREYELKYQDYRALAEGLRVQSHWRAVGILDSVADYYLRKQKSELDWIRDSIRSSRILSDAHASKNPGEGSALKCLQVVYEKWIVDQRNWFAKSAKTEQRKAVDFNEIASAAFIGGLVVAFVVAGWLLATHTPIEEVAWREPFVTVVALSAVVAGLLHNYSEKRGWSAHSKQYARMQLTFTLAATKTGRLLDQPSEPNIVAACRLLHDLGREALIENGDWLLLHRERPIDIPGG